ncbi:protein kinase [Dactylosporangium aurantiacum]|uniref:Protein kinase n=1 Tax=Dactylosporangium aurantiacum TaxID=35754 RepID=A0A9Q9MEX4_9ACTN|nr:protein kinase [Dactylosporangium aurantiacum]MDG6109223.1 protein kinase [Dactylosporangium aurantiacum]UWZ56618.1 protein kinase [Dactylosporangium aurantiacum]
MSGTADEVLGNRYRLIAPVGTGGMAVVWRAQDLVLDRDVAIKLLAEELANKPGNRERIRAEAQVVARLQHPNITAVHDYGEAGDAQAGRHGRRPYVVMELLEGELLSNRLRSGPMSWRRATQICAQVAAGLAAAHERHVVHRDIKPSNIMLTAAGAKILDFGVAGLTGSFDPDDEDGTVFGTPAYLAPERLLGGGVIPATDVYTVGLLVYRCLTDRLPWHADTPTQMIANHVYEPPHPLPDIPGLPRDIGQLVAQCLAKDPATRPPAAYVARTLAAATGIHVVLPGEDGTSTQEVHAPATAVPRPSEPVEATFGREVTVPRQRAARRRSRRAVLGAALAVVLAVGAGALAVWKPWEPRPACSIDYYSRPEPADGVDRGFAARIVIANSGNRPADPWRLHFLLPGGQEITQITGGLATWERVGGGVRMTGAYALPPGKALTVGMNGARGVQPLPTDFTVNDVACDTRWADLRRGATLPPMTDLVNPPKDENRPKATTPPGPPEGGGPPGGGGFDGDRPPPPPGEDGGGGPPPSGRPTSTAGPSPSRYVQNRA